MINLLPPDVKENISYARRNTKLRKWAVAILMSILLIGGVVSAGYLYMQSSIKTYQAKINEGNQILKSENLENTQAEVQDLTNSLKLVVQVLQREILFSKLLGKVGRTLPSGSVLTNLSINKIQGGLDLQAAAVDYQTATQVHTNLQDPNNKIFEKADIISIQCSTPKPSDATLSGKYPCNIQLRTLFAKNNEFSFITAPSGSTKP